MEQIALISDLHANLPAVEAVFDDIFKRDIKRIFCLGDFVGKGAKPDEVITLCRKYCELSVYGNWDDFLLRSGKHENPIQWYIDRISEENVKYLESLPRVIEFYLSSKTVRLFHAHPFDVYRRLYDTSDKKRVEEMFEYDICDLEFKYDKKSDIVGYGDIHHAFIRFEDDRLFFNTGSVGNPLDGLSASYAILEGEYGLKETAPYSAKIVRVPYDIKKAVSDIKNSDMPQKERYIKEIETGKFFGRIMGRL